MNKESKIVYPHATAPPLFEESVRIVQPFEIAEATEVRAVESEFESLLPNQIQSKSGQYRGPSVIPHAGKAESKEARQKIAQSRYDGENITRDDHNTVLQADNSGRMEHLQNNMKIRYSNNDYVHQLGASLPLPTPTAMESVLSGNTYSSPNPIDEKVRALQEASKPKGYQPAEYTSMYDSEGGYKFQDYKSIYD